MTRRRCRPPTGRYRLRPHGRADPPRRTRVARTSARSPRRTRAGTDRSSCTATGRCRSRRRGRSRSSCTGRSRARRGARPSARGPCPRRRAPGRRRPSRSARRLPRSRRPRRRPGGRSAHTPGSLSSTAAVRCRRRSPCRPGRQTRRGRSSSRIGRWPRFRVASRPSFGSCGQSLPSAWRFRGLMLTTTESPYAATRTAAGTAINAGEIDTPRSNSTITTAIQVDTVVRTVSTLTHGGALAGSRLRPRYRDGARPRCLAGLDRPVADDVRPDAILASLVAHRHASSTVAGQASRDGHRHVSAPPRTGCGTGLRPSRRRLGPVADAYRNPLRDASSGTVVAERMVGCVARTDGRSGVLRESPRSQARPAK